MKLQKLVGWLREDRGGAEDWPVFFTGFHQDASGAWEECGDRSAITAVEAEGDEVLVITYPDQPPLSLSSLETTLAALLPQCGDFAVDHCEDPISMDGGRFHIDAPVNGSGRCEKDRCYLLVVATSEKSESQG